MSRTKSTRAWAAAGIANRAVKATSPPRSKVRICDHLTATPASGSGKIETSHDARANASQPVRLRLVLAFSRSYVSPSPKAKGARHDSQNYYASAWTVGQADHRDGRKVHLALLYASLSADDAARQRRLDRGRRRHPDRVMPSRHRPSPYRPLSSASRRSDPTP